MAKQQALGNHSIFALGSKQKATSLSKLKIYHSLLALGFKPNAGSHLSLNPFHFYLAEGSKPKALSYSKLKTHHSKLAESLKLEAYGLYAALPLAFLALGCSPVLVSYILCVVFLGTGRFLCALSRKPKAVGKSIDFRNKSLEIRYWKALCRRLNTSGNHSKLKTHHLSLAVGKRLRALCNNLLFAIGNLKQLVQFLVAGFSPVATKQINY